MMNTKMAEGLVRLFEFDELKTFVESVKEWGQWDDEIQEKGITIVGNPLESAICKVVDMITQGRRDLTDYFWNEVIWGDATAEDWFEKILED